MPPQKCSKGVPRRLLLRFRLQQGRLGAAVRCSTQRESIGPEPLGTEKAGTESSERMCEAGSEREQPQGVKRKTRARSHGRNPNPKNMAAAWARRRWAVIDEAMEAQHYVGYNKLLFGIDRDELQVSSVTL